MPKLIMLLPNFRQNWECWTSAGFSAMPRCYGHDNERLKNWWTEGLANRIDVDSYLMRRPDVPFLERYVCSAGLSRDCRLWDCHVNFLYEERDSSKEGGQSRWEIVSLNGYSRLVSSELFLPREKKINLDYYTGRGYEAKASRRVLLSRNRHWRRGNLNSLHIKIAKSVGWD